MLIQIDAEKFLEMTLLMEYGAALQYVTQECRKQMADMEKYIEEKDEATTTGTI